MYIYIYVHIISYDMISYHIIYTRVIMKAVLAGDGDEEDLDDDAARMALLLALPVCSLTF